MAAGIASGFVRKLYRILDQESETIIAWDLSGASFSIHDSKQLNDAVLPRYFRGRMSAFRQQLLDHGFEQIECEENETRECYAHPHFIRGLPDRLSFIVRVPKPKLKAGASLPTATQPPQAQPPHFTPHNALRQPPGSLSVHISPQAMGMAGRAPLTVTLMTHKRASPVHNAQDDAAQKRLRATAAAAPVASTSSRRPTGPVQAPTLTPTPTPTPNLSRNPLFSNEPSSTDGLDVARVFSLSRISDSGLFPNSTDLPEPISYLSKMLHSNGAAAASSQGASSSSSSVSTSSNAPPSIDAPVFSEDMMRSALYFLVSGTGVEQTSNGDARPRDDAWTEHVQRLSTSGFLSSLMVSSATGKDAGGSHSGALSSSSVWGPTSTNPLFSKSSEQDEEEEDSIWNLLVASSIDRVKTAIHDVVSPQERLRLILEERERLEEQRKRIFGVDDEAATETGTGTSTQAQSSGPHKPTETQTATPLKSVLKKTSPATVQREGRNPLFSAPKSTVNPLFTKPAATASKNPLFTKDEEEEEKEEDAETGGSGGAFFGSVLAEKNPLFSSAPSTSIAPTTTPAATSAGRLAPTVPSTAEDGLWRLLMTSSVDWFRKGAEDLDV